MNAPPPPAPIDYAMRRPGQGGRCPTTQLTVPECSCQSCLTELMRAHAPAAIAARVGQPALS
jgi:hypothetical protein